MTATTIVRAITLVSVACFLVLLAVSARAELPAASSPDALSGVAHHWVMRQMGASALDTPTALETRALSLARNALAYPPADTVSAAERGYELPAQQIAQAKTLLDAEPTIVGTELTVFNDRRAARVYVDRDGMVRVLDSGAVNELLLTPAVPIVGGAAADALETLRASGQLASAIDTSTVPIGGAVLTAHGVGFASPVTGSHLVVRVGVDGQSSYTDW